MLLSIITLLIVRQLVAASPNPTNQSSLLDDYPILSSEKTPTVAPNRVTKKGDTAIDAPLFESDCSEPLSRDVSCSVHLIACDAPIMAPIEIGNEPPRAHDVRIAPIAKVIGANRIDKREHRLHVDISWQMPHQESSKNLRAFKLHVTGPNAKSTCFVFNVTHHETDETTAPRFRFTTNTLFDFAKPYNITISSLPRSTKFAPKVTETNVRMPDDPDEMTTSRPEYCTKNSNPQASKWAASFRKIFLFSVARMIQIEFVAAPPQYCFEEYEVRLLDSSGIVMLQSAIIRQAHLKTEMINGRAVQFGEHNFTNIDLNTDLIPSVIPIETAGDGRCLCETENGCSCLAADWKPVKLVRVEKPNISSNRTMIVEDALDNSYPKWHIFALTISLLLLATFVFCISCALCFYKRYGKSQKSVNVRFISDNPSFSSSGTAPLILKQTPSVLILYAHDSTWHDLAVLAFAELLRDIFEMEVHIDTWDELEIEANRAEYINSSIVRADKVIIINSQGAYHRIAARHMRQPQVRRVGANTLNDDIFESQIDLALQHVRIISTRFTYTPSNYTLFALSPLLQFSIPENLNLLLASLTDNSGATRRLAGYNANVAKLQTAVRRVAEMMREQPDWLEKTHYRVPLAITPPPNIAHTNNDTIPMVDRYEDRTPTLDSAYVSGSELSGSLTRFATKIPERCDSAFLDDGVAVE